MEVWVTIVLGVASLVLAAGNAVRIEKRARISWIVIALVLLAIGGPFTYVAVQRMRDNQRSTQAETAQPGKDLRFDPVTKVLECTVYPGSGHIPDGYDLMLFDRAINGDGNALSRTWSITNATATNKDTGGWRTSVVNLGAEHVELTAVVVSADVYRSLTSIHDVHQIDILPPGFQLPSLKLDLTLQTPANPAGCQ